MSVFAGFWVDGAVRKPEKRHFDVDGCMLAKWKRSPDAGWDFDMLDSGFGRWDSVYWLDTTPRESLTPEELLSVLRIIWPSTNEVYKHNDATWYVDEIERGVDVDWGNLTQYPPPAEPQWIEVTRDNVGQYLFRECRTQNNDITYFGRIVGWCIEDDCCLVESDYQAEEPILKWDIVEVQNAPPT